MKPTITAVLRATLLSACVAALGVQPASAQAAWTDWTSATVGTAGSASGTLTFGGTDIAVRYSGEVNGNTSTSGWNHWLPASTFSTATVPAPTEDIIALASHGITNTITFSQPVLDPLMAIWSLGGGSTVGYVFDSALNFSILAGGPNANYGGSSITRTGNTVFGREGNGLIQFTGNVKSITFTVDSDEFWHGFTVGAAGPASSSVTPEPVSMALLATGLAGVAAARRRRKAGAQES